MKQYSLIDEEAADWLARKDRGAWSEALQAELDAWLGEATANRVAYLRLAAAWKRPDALRAATNESAFAPASKRYAGWRIAASVLLVIGAGVAGQAWLQQDADAGAAYQTPVGAHQSVALADGSQVTLNTNSRVRASIADGKRQVWLDRGEAFFEIAHDAAHPFIVQAGENKITVLGTKFSVRREAGRVDVAVLEGKVQVETVSAAGQRRTAILNKNEAALAGQDRLQLARRSPQQIATSLLWREGKLVFDQVSLAAAAEEFNRYNTRKIVIADSEAAAVRIGGQFEAKNIDGFARLLNEGFGLQVVTGAEEIRISAAPAQDRKAQPKG